MIKILQGVEIQETFIPEAEKAAYTQRHQTMQKALLFFAIYSQFF